MRKATVLKAHLLPRPYFNYQSFPAGGFLRAQPPKGGSDIRTRPELFSGALHHLPAQAVNTLSLAPS